LSDSTPPRDWYQLTAQEQLALREAYGRYLDGLPPTCDLTEKNERFRRWLAERGIAYRPVDR
jgi:hypothetical protein